MNFKLLNFRGSTLSLNKTIVSILFSKTQNNLFDISVSHGLTVFSSIVALYIHSCILWK